MQGMQDMMNGGMMGWGRREFLRAGVGTVLSASPLAGALSLTGCRVIADLGALVEWP